MSYQRGEFWISHLEIQHFGYRLRNYNTQRISYWNTGFLVGNYWRDFIHLF